MVADNGHAVQRQGRSASRSTVSSSRPAARPVRWPVRLPASGRKDVSSGGTAAPARARSHRPPRCRCGARCRGWASRCSGGGRWRGTSANVVERGRGSPACAGMAPASSCDRWPGWSPPQRWHAAVLWTVGGALQRGVVHQNSAVAENFTSHRRTCADGWPPVGRRPACSRGVAGAAVNNPAG